MTNEQRFDRAFESRYTFHLLDGTPVDSFVWPPFYGFTPEELFSGSIGASCSVVIHEE